MSDKKRSAYDAGISLLARREHSAFEIKQKLCARDFTNDEITQAIDDLIRNNYLSDERFSEAFVESKVKRGYGSIYIIQALKSRGIVDDVYDLLVDYDWVELASSVRNKKFGIKVITDYKLIAKQKSFLQYRGFDLDVINIIFKEL